MTIEPERSHAVPAQLRRRRNASRRLPTLFDGRRDPIDPPPRSRRVAITCTIDKYSAHFTGPTSAILNACTAADVTAMRRIIDRDQVSVPVGFADDVIAQLRYAQGRVVNVIDQGDDAA